ncbi:MAG TPA: hypothetical protein VNX21_01285 [Candidatus Thermoplasmatota archaeon]|nr:hypothetical protein [Candidatus Thermoplasmatota archaeon]
MPSKWHRATYALLAAGAAEAATGFANDLALLSVILGLATVAVGVITLRRGARFEGLTWAVAAVGASLAFRAFVYQAAPWVVALVAASGALYLATLVLAYAAWRAEVQERFGARRA